MKKNVTVIKINLDKDGRVKDSIQTSSEQIIVCLPDEVCQKLMDIDVLDYIFSDIIDHGCVDGIYEYGNYMVEIQSVTGSIENITSAYEILSTHELI